MNLRPVPLLATTAALLLGPGCTRDEPTPENDRTLKRLKEEADRLAAQGPMAAPPRPAARPENPTAALAERAAANGETKPAGGDKLRLPEGNATVHVGTVAVKLIGLSVSDAQSAGKVTLTTQDLFLRIQLITQNVGERASKLDLDVARVTDGKGGDWSLARDVQRMAGTRELAAQLPPSERREYVLFFEVPRPGPAKGWSLLLPASAGGEQDVSIPLG